MKYAGDGGVCAGPLFDCCMDFRLASILVAKNNEGLTERGMVTFPINGKIRSGKVTDSIYNTSSASRSAGRRMEGVEQIDSRSSIRHRH